MNSRYMRPAPQGAQLPRRAEPLQMQWPTMSVPPPPQIAPQQGGDPLMSGLTQLGAVAVNPFGGGDEPVAPPVNVQAEQTAPVAVEPPIPIAPPPAYGARPDQMAKKKPGILEMLLGGGNA